MEEVELSAAQIKQLRKENRILARKLERSQAELSYLEQGKRNKESLLKKVIAELEQSQEVLELQRADLKRVIEQLKKTQSQLVEAEKFSALGGLVAGVAHEINTPVGTSITLASTLAYEIDQFQTAVTQGPLKRSQLNHYLAVAQETIQLILSSLNRAGDLVQTFKQVAVDQSHQEKRTFAVKAYLEDVCKSLGPQIRAQGLFWQVTGEEITILGYPGLLAQILSNLITNSLTHAYAPGDCGCLQLHIHSQDNELILLYKDDGRGIPPESLSKVFEPFYTTARESGGTGLGMHIVHNIVTQNLHGSIKLTSLPGQGIEMQMTFPIESS